MTKGDIINIHSDFNGCWISEGWAKLIRLIEIVGEYELWDVEFLDCEGKVWPWLIKSNQ
jgi:hypothetical protein